jgi:hypothetical protein
VPLFEPIFEALNREGVRYVVVGGVAVLLHGHVRLTADLDLAVDLEPAEARKAIETLVGMGLRPTIPVDPIDFAEATKRSEWMTEKHMRVFSMSDPTDPLREVDLFVENPIDFDGMWKRSRIVDLGSTSARIASIDDLIVMKRSAGRPQDLADVEALETILREGNPDG